MSDRMGRGSEQLYNEQLYKIFESIKHLLDIPEENRATPDKPDLHGSLWLDTVKNELNYFNKDIGEWDNIFRDKFKIVDNLLNNFPPDRPVYGQLWINQDVLMFYNGYEWRPIKALMQDGSQINLSVFEDFLMLSPLNPLGNRIINDQSQIPENRSQFLAPNLDVGKFFIDGNYRSDYEEINKVTLQYPKIKLENKTPSWIHVNPGKLTAINKRLFKVDKDSQFIPISTFNTELYGFQLDSPFGKFLRPKKESGDYVVTPDGVQLEYHTAQNYDFILAVTYEFSWIKASGKLNRTDTKKKSASYYVGGFGGPINVFVEGYDLENSYYEYDSVTKTVNVTDPDINMDMDVSVMRSIKREYGIIRERTLDGKGIIKLRSRYLNPLIFTNGQAMHSSLGDIEVNNADGVVLVKDARRDMSYSVMELNDTENNLDMFLGSGTVNETIDGKGVIRINDFANKIKPEEGIILFVDGLLVKKEDVIKDYINGYITADGLEETQEYIVLYDKYNALLFEDNKLQGAIVVGKVDESLVFMNELLICNDTAIVTSKTKDEMLVSAINGEIRLFIESEEDKLKGEFAIYDSYDKVWKPMTQRDIDSAKLISFSYENALNIIALNIPYVKEDIFEIYAYNFANTIDKPLLINSFYVTDQDDFQLSQYFIAGTNALQVFLNGVRQYNITEYADGRGFTLPKKVTGKITYIIEYPENGSQQSCTREVLGYEDCIAPNVYKTKKSLYPGRVTVYVSGIRQPMDSFSILDNNTIVFKDKNIRLTGCKDNYPKESIMKKDGSIVEITKTHYDEILIEVRQKFELKEQTIIINEENAFDIDIKKYDLPVDIIEAADEILIYINGVFFGLRNGLGYIKNRAKGSITITDPDALRSINLDYLYNFFSINHEKHLEWQDKHGGKPYERKLNSKVTLEWR